MSSLKFPYLLLYYAIVLGISFYLIVPVSLMEKEDHENHHHTLFKHILVSSTRSPLVKNHELSVVSAGIMEKIVLDILSSHMRFTYEIIPPADILSSGYLQKNGSWTGTTGQLQRKEVDMCVTWVAHSSSKSPILDVSYPVVFVDSSIIIPFPKEKNKVWIDHSTFEGVSGLMIGGAFAFMIIATWITHRITNSRLGLTSPNVFYWLYIYVSIWASQGLTLGNRSSPFRLVFLVSIFGVFIITNFFTVSYTSVLSIPVYKPIATSIEDLANSNTVKTLLIKGSSTDEYIMSSTDPVLEKIGDQMRLYPERRILNALTVEDISTIVKEDSALIIVKSNGESLIEQSYKLNNECRVTLAEKTFFSRPQTFTYPKNSPIVKEIDYDLLLLHQSGLIQYAEKRASMEHNRCRLSDRKKDQADKIAPLKLRNQMNGAFVFLCAGLSLGVLVFLVEMIIEKLCCKKSAIII
uniref:Ionotropic glutamate receptor C-terminal domain-containing protein n=1 Tax=Daphnia galeata TaxID=27404 RepID=A0A8J2RYH3_9CRUS|nr:unnamed protein product [Daphnia galeata]